jgi:uncharacterized membrane protein
MHNKWTSRKFWLTIIAMVYSVAATLGMNIPIEQVVITNAVVAVFVLAEAIVDAVKKS